MDLADNPFEETPQMPANSSVISGEPVEAFPVLSGGAAEPAPHRLAVLGKPHRFTAENARLMSLKAVEARKQKALSQVPIPVVVSAPVDPIALRVQRINSRIEAIIDEMETSESAKDTQALAMALDRLCGVWSLLTGHPRPGVRKTDTKGRRMDFAKPSD